jgi:DNA-binding XRE family transcriptional regulator
MTMTIESATRVPHLRLKELRIDKGLSPNDLGHRAGISGKTVRMAEAGITPRPRVQHAIASVFGLRPTELWPLVRTDEQ